MDLAYPVVQYSVTVRPDSLDEAKGSGRKFLASLSMQSWRRGDCCPELVD